MNPVPIPALPGKAMDLATGYNGSSIIKQYRKDLLEAHRMDEEDAEYFVRLFTPHVIESVRRHTAAALARVHFGAVVTHMAEEKKKDEEVRRRPGKTRSRKRQGREQPQQ